MLLTILWEFVTSDLCMSMIQIPNENMSQHSLPFQKKEAEAVTPTAHHGRSSSEANPVTVQWISKFLM